VAPARAAEENRRLVGDELAVAAGEDWRRLIKQAWYYWLLLAAGHLHRRLFARCFADEGSAGAEQVALRLLLQNVAEGGELDPCLRNRLRGSKPGSPDGAKTSRLNLAISLGFVLVAIRCVEGKRRVRCASQKSKSEIPVKEKKKRRITMKGCQSVY